MILDYSASKSDKLVASAVNLKGGDVLVRTGLNAEIASGLKFDGFDGTISNTGATVKGSLPGWKWNLNTSTGEFSLASTIGTFNDQTTTISNDKDIYTSGNNKVYTNKTINMTGGNLTLYRSAYFGSNGSCTVNQSGGIVFNAVPASAGGDSDKWFVLNESSTNQKTIWTMTKDAKFYSTSGTNMVVGKSQLGQFDLQNDVVFHVNNIKLGTVNGSNYGRGLITQSGNSSAYINNLKISYRNNTYSTQEASEYRLDGGTLVVNSLITDYTTLSIKPKVTLNGGTFAVATDTGVDLTVNGSTVEIYGNVATTLTDFNYLNDGDDATDRPTGFTAIGTTTLTSASYIQNDGKLILDYKSNASGDYDVLKAPTADFNGGEIIVRTDPETKLSSDSSFKGIQATTLTLDNTSVRGSLAGWNWKIAADGTISADMTKATAAQTTVADKGYYTDADTTFTNAMTISDGSLVLQGDTAFASSVTQTGGVVVSTQAGGNLDAGKDYNLSGGGLYFNGADSKALTISSGTFNLSGDGILHVSDLTLASAAKAVVQRAVEQTGGSAYVSELRIVGSDSAYNLSDGTLLVGNLTGDKNPGQVNLTGGTFALASGDMAVTNKGATMEIYGNLANALANFDYLNDGNDATDRPTGYTTYGTTNLTGAYTLESGKLVLDFSSSTAADKLAATTVNLTGGEVLVRTAIDAKLANGLTFDAFDGTVTKTGTVIKGSLPGWNWTLDPATGKLTTSAKMFTASTNSIQDGDSYIVTATAPANEIKIENANINMTGGTLTLQKGLYLNGNSKFNQSGGTVFIPSNCGWWLVLNESGATTSKAGETVWTMSNDAKFYSMDTVHRINVGKSTLGEFILKDDAIMHAASVLMGVQNGTSYGRGMIEQSGNSQAYFGKLQISSRDKTSYGTDKPCEYVLNGGKLVINELVTDYGQALKGEMTLKGGTFSVANSNGVNITLDGGTIEILGDIAAAVNDYSYINDGNDLTNVPVGFTDYGTMTITGDVKLLSGRLLFDVSSDMLQQDLLKIVGDVEINKDAVEIVVNYDGELTDFMGKPIQLVDGDKLKEAVDGLVVRSSFGGDALYFGSNGELLVNPSYVPEPATWVLLVLGLGLGARFLRKRRG